MSDLPTTDLPLEELPPNNHVLAIMGANGDTKHMWDTNDPIQVEAARKLFTELREKGYMAFRLVSYEKDGKRYVKKGDAMPEFEAGAGRMRLSRETTRKWVQPPANAEEVAPIQGEPATTFDPTANHILVPPMQGG